MTLFVQMPNRRFEISEIYVMGFCFIVSYLLVRTGKALVVRLTERKKIVMANPKGGDLSFRITDDNELANIILNCINDDEIYQVVNDDIKKLIFNLLKRNIKNQSLVLTPNFMRFLAVNVLAKNDSLIIRVGQTIFSTDNKIRLFVRALGGVALGTLAAIVGLVPYFILLAIAYFDSTENCGRPCDNYFEKLPKQEIVKAYTKTENSNLFIAGNDEARQIQIYVPQGKPQVVSSGEKKQSIVQQKYKPSRKWAKQVNFADFKRNDPVLSSFQNLEEPYVEQKVCPLNDISDVIRD